MNKGLVALKHLYAKLSCKSSIEEIDENLQEYDTIEKALKAIDIVREMFLNGTDVTKVLLAIYQSKDFEEFQKTHMLANRQKYKLLKEMFK